MSFHFHITPRRKGDHTPLRVFRFVGLVPIVDLLQAGYSLQLSASVLQCASSGPPEKRIPLENSLWLPCEPGAFFQIHNSRSVQGGASNSPPYQSAAESKWSKRFCLRQKFRIALSFCGLNFQIEALNQLSVLDLRDTTEISVILWEIRKTFDAYFQTHLKSVRETSKRYGTFDANRTAICITLRFYGTMKKGEVSCSSPVYASVH